MLLGPIPNPALTAPNSSNLPLAENMAFIIYTADHFCPMNANPIILKIWKAEMLLTSALAAKPGCLCFLAGYA
jgi:hypothetical protein